MTATTTFGKYQVLEKIGRGAMGVVWKAQDGVLGRTVAIKTIGATVAFGGPSDDQLELFRREARSVAGLNHPNVVTIYDFGEVDEQLYMVMELLEGVDLTEAVRRQLLQTPVEKLELMRQVTAGVSYAHSRDIVHRDLKPANVRVLPDGSAKIMDFGLARAREAEATRTGRMVGTPHYMAPEQVRGNRADTRSDVFSLGVMFYEVLTGQRPFPAQETHAVLFQILQREPEPAHSVDPTLPPAFDEILARALAKTPEERYQNASELHQSLMAVDLTATAPGSRPPAPAPASTPSTPPSLTGLARPQPGSRPGSWPSTVGSTAPLGPALRVTFQQEDGGGASDRVLELQDRRSSLLDLALANGISHFHECGGRGRCSTCRVRVTVGLENLEPRTPQEVKLARHLGWAADIRLACQTRLKGDVCVERLVRDTDDVGMLFGERARAMPAQEMALAMMSCDLLDFSERFGKSPPYDQIHVLNRFFLQIAEPVMSNDGAIQGYSGAGFRAFFGLRGGSARQKCLSSVRAALRAVSRMETFNRYAETYFGQQFRLGVGLHFGRMIVGEFGHPAKMELSVLGDTSGVIELVSARNASAGTFILATEEMINVVEDELHLGHVLSDEEVRGRIMTLYEVVDLQKPDAVFIVQRTFELLEARAEEVAPLFYEVLFEVDPGVRALFDGVDMKLQGGKLLKMLAMAVKGLDDLESLVPVLQDLGRRHQSYGVELRHYDSVEQALLETVRRLTGESFDLDVRLAWTRVVGQMATVMTDGLP